MDTIYPQARQPPDQSLAAKASWSIAYTVSIYPPNPTGQQPHYSTYRTASGSVKSNCPFGFTLHTHTHTTVSTQPGHAINNVHLLFRKLGPLQSQRCEIHIILVDIASRSHDAWYVSISISCVYTSIFLRLQC